MTSWKDFAADQPDFAARVRQLFKSQKHMTIATLRRDGSPRISGTEVELDADELVLGMMPGSLKARDLLRDARLALHSPSVDPPPGDERAWPGDAKIAGRAVEITDKDPADTAHRFRVDITEVVLTKVAPSGEHLLIESWHPDGGLQSRQRA